MVKIFSTLNNFTLTFHIRDRKKKRFVNEDNGEAKKKKVKTESGIWIPASYKSDLYKKWKERSKAEHQDTDESDKEHKQLPNKRPRRTKASRPPKRELKSKDEILKERRKQERKKSYQKWKENEKSKRNKTKH